MAKQKIELHKDFTIGYFSGLLGKGKFRTLATVKEDIALPVGTYHLAAGNGTGKTTLLKTLARLIPPGKQGCKITGSLQCLFDNLSWDDELTGRDIIESFRRNMDMTCVERLTADLDADLLQPYSVLSRGQRQKINIIMVEGCAAVQPDAVLLYDEPLSGIDTQSVEKLAEYWKGTENKALRIFSEHLKHPSVAIQGVIQIKDQVISFSGPQ